VCAVGGGGLINVGKVSSFVQLVSLPTAGGDTGVVCIKETWCESHTTTPPLLLFLFIYLFDGSSSSSRVCVLFFLSPANIFLWFLFSFLSHVGDPCLLLGEEGTVEGRGSLPLFLY
jgi:hypothetical protein